MLYHLIALTVAALSLVRGFKLGFARQTPAVIGTAFGIVSAHLLSGGLRQVLYDALPTLHGSVGQNFIYDTMATAIVFVCIYGIFRGITGFLGKVLQGSDHSILDNIAGAAFSFFKWMLFLSIGFNLLVAFNMRSELVKAARSDDGNASLLVTRLAPAVLGGESIDDLVLDIQLEEAKKISKNEVDENKTTPDVV